MTRLVEPSRLPYLLQRPSGDIAERLAQRVLLPPDGSGRVGAEVVVWNHRGRMAPSEDELAADLAAAIANYTADKSGSKQLPEAIERRLDDLLHGYGGDGTLELTVAESTSTRLTILGLVDRSGDIREHWRRRVSSSCLRSGRA